MSAGVCAVCLGAAPAFTGAIGESPEDRVVGVHCKDVHGQARHIVVCHGCTVLIVSVWARAGKHRMARLRQKAQPNVADTVVACNACGVLHLDGDEHECDG